MQRNEYATSHISTTLNVYSSYTSISLIPNGPPLILLIARNVSPSSTVFSLPSFETIFLLSRSSSTGRFRKPPTCTPACRVSFELLAVPPLPCTVVPLPLAGEKSINDLLNDIIEDRAARSRFGSRFVLRRDGRFRFKRRNVAEARNAAREERRTRRQRSTVAGPCCCRRCCSCSCAASGCV